MRQKQKSKAFPEFPSTGIGQLRKVLKRDILDEKAAFAYLVKRGVAQLEYVWRAVHTDKTWCWRRIG